MMEKSSDISRWWVQTHQETLRHPSAHKQMRDPLYLPATIRRAALLRQFETILAALPEIRIFRGKATESVRSLTNISAAMTLLLQLLAR